MRLPKAVIAAANTYFAFKNKSGNGMFENGYIKSACLNAVDRACHKHAIDFYALPGLLMFSRGNQKRELSGPVAPGDK